MRWTIYIVRRTQLDLDDQSWQTLHADAQTSGTTISDLVRKAVREKYFGNAGARAAAMRNFVGIRKNRRDIPDSTEYIRGLRRGNRLAALKSQ
jgi:hypothetical protein